jgi:hypothetical protein
MSNYQYFLEPQETSSRTQWWIDGQRRLLSQLKTASDNLIYITDTPNPLRDIPNCLSTSKAEDCTTPKRPANVVISGFKKIDPTPWLCTDTCPAIKDGYVVYRDGSHISVEASLALTPFLEKALRNAGLFS